MTVLGTTIFTEFQKPTRIPLHSSPVQACVQAEIHGSSVKFCGSAKRAPWRISSIGFTEVTSIT